MGIENIDILHNDVLVELDVRKTSVFVTSSAKEEYTGKATVIGIGHTVAVDVNIGDVVYLRNSVVYADVYKNGNDVMKHPQSIFYPITSEDKNSLPKIALINEYDIVMVERADVQTA